MPRPVCACGLKAAKTCSRLYAFSAIAVVEANTAFSSCHACAARAYVASCPACCITHGTFARCMLYVASCSKGYLSYDAVGGASAGAAGVKATTSDAAICIEKACLHAHTREERDGESEQR